MVCANTLGRCVKVKFWFFSVCNKQVCRIRVSIRLSQRLVPGFVDGSLDVVGFGCPGSGRVSTSDNSTQALNYTLPTPETTEDAFSALGNSTLLSMRVRYFSLAGHLRGHSCGEARALAHQKGMHHHLQLVRGTAAVQAEARQTSATASHVRLHVQHAHLPGLHPGCCPNKVCGAVCAQREFFQEFFRKNSFRPDSMVCCLSSRLDGPLARRDTPAGQRGPG